MHLWDQFEIVEPYPALYWQEENTVIVADLHLGLEALMASTGVYFPKFQLKEIKEDLEEVLEEKQPRQLIINGDVKHEFSQVSYEEQDEVQELLETLIASVDEIKITKGNHDNYLIYAVQDYEQVQLEDKFVIGDTCLLHGDQNIDPGTIDATYFIIGHEHPALSLQDEIGVREKLPAFLYGTLDSGDKKIIVMPAFSRLAQGSPVNRSQKRELMSPILKNYVVVDNLRAVGITPETGVMKFPSLGQI